MALYDPNLLVEMECPVCTDYMHPPIRHCNTGHSFCNRCFAKLTKCPTCRMTLKTAGRNFVLERLHSKLVFPCKYREDGCCQIEIGSWITNHENACHFGGRDCPLKVINDCGWQGRLKDMVTHCKQDHPNNIFCTNKQRLTCADFLLSSVNSTSYYFIIFHTYEKYFKCAWDVNFDTGHMRWCVFLMTPPENAGTFEFEIEILNQNRTSERICMKARCPVEKPGQELFNNQQFAVTHYEMVKHFCKGNDLIYNVKIIKRSDHFNY